MQLDLKIISPAAWHLDHGLVRLFRQRTAWRPAFNRKARRRAGVAAGVLLGHALVLWLLIAGHDPAAQASMNSGATIGLDLVGAARQTVPKAEPKAKTAQVKSQAAVKLDAEVATTPAPQSDPALTDVAYSLPVVAAADSPPVLSDADAQALSRFAPASAQIGAGPACNLTPAVVRDFSQSPLVRQGVSELPAGEKSVANAVQIWDGAWPDETQSGGKALIRALLTREIAAAPADCRKQVNNGPVFFVVPDGAATAIVAVGSGQWTWGQLVE